MRAIVINRYGGPDVLETADVPMPVPAAGETLVRVLAAAVNPADPKWRAGMFESFAPVGFPHVLGYDIAGEVLAGSEFPDGARVFGMLDPFRKGGYAEFVAVASQQIAAIPDGLDTDVAAALPTAGLTGLQLIDDALDVRADQHVLVTGAAGAVGRFAIAAIRARGAIATAAVRPSQAEEALRLGADGWIPIESSTWTGAPFDHVADTVGGEAVARLCRGLRPGGRIATVATTPIPREHLAAQPIFYAVRPDSGGLARLAALVVSGAVPVPVAEVLPLEEAAAAHRLVERGGLAGKIVLRP